MAGSVSLGDNVRWHRNRALAYPAFLVDGILVDGSVGVVTAKVPGDPMVTVDFEVQGLADVHIEDLVLIIPDLRDTEEVEAWLSR